MSNISDDLVQIRKSKRLSRQDVYYKCRLPIETIEAIEDGSIFSGTTKNKTYLRSYFRTYAKAVGIADSDMINALDEHEIGTYNDGLYQIYVAGNSGGRDSEDKKKDTAEEDWGKPDKKADDKEPEQQAKGSADESDRNDTGSASEESSPQPADDRKKNESLKKSQTITPESQEKTIDDVEWEDKSLKKPLSTSTMATESAAGASSSSDEKSAPPDLKNIDWASRVKTAVYKPQRNRLFWVIIAILLALAIAAGSIYWFWQPEEDPLTRAPAAEENAVTAENESGSHAGDTDDTGADPEESTAAAGSGTGDSPQVAEPSDQAEPPAPDEAPEPDGQVAPDDPGIAGEEPVADDISGPETSDETIGELGMPVEDQDDDAAAEMDESTITDELFTDSVEDDTLFIYAYALHGNLEPIRVHSDLFTEQEDNGSLPLRPYWVEQGQLMRFDFTDEITFQGTLSRMVLIFNGNLIEDFSQFYLDGTRVRLTRADLADNDQFAEPDSDIFENMPLPVSILDRPRFSP